MTINYLGENAFLVKTRDTEITAGRPTIAGGLTLDGPGEYEVGDARIKGFPGAYLVSAEDINLLYIDNPKGLPEETVKKIEEDIDILLLSMGSEAASIKTAVKTVNDLDPDIAIPAVYDSAHPFCKEIGGCQDPVAELKISKKDLVEEVRKVVILHARSADRK